MTTLRSAAVFVVIGLSGFAVVAAPGPDPGASSAFEEHCSSLAFDNDGDVVFGCNYDSRIDDEGLVLVNKRGLRKLSYQPGTTGRTAEWTARYASITFTLLGYQFPWAGMNERGLSLSTMALSETECPSPDERPLLESGFYLQYLLDTCETVEEVIAVDAEVRIDTVDHYLVVDRFGGVTVLEFLNGGMAATTGSNLCTAALTNNLYEDSCGLWESLREVGDYRRQESSVHRFCLAADRAQDFQPGNTAHGIDYAFETLHMVREQLWGGNTRWSIVFDAANRRAYFRTERNPEIRWADLGAFDSRCSGVPQMLDINTGLTGDVTGAFSDYSIEANRDLIEGYLDRWDIEFDHDQISALLDLFSGYTCTRTRRAPDRRLAPAR